ncbi:MAG: DUF2336 domain-containing protein [Phenylobacterium sp.]|uniref:DUF2336 domain-containing protein n=1 Tax=Phenylobacterium sp. TaxID=1871053 RepID=UPI0039192AC7
MSVVAKTEQILGLAKSRSPADRERLLMAVVDLCGAGMGDEDAPNAAAVRGLLNSILMNLVVEAERDIRRRLAEKLAGAPWASVALINVLALDDIEIARPVIAASPALQDQDLVRLLIEATIEHQIEVARRPNIGAPVVAQILKQKDPAVMTALAGNHSAAVDEAAMDALVRASEHVETLRSPLAVHPALTDDLAKLLYVWVGRSLRGELVERFRLDPEALGAALAESVKEAHAGHRPDPGSVRPKPADREGMDRLLIAKLNAAGQLRPGYLLRALREQKLSLFVIGLATLGRLEASQVRQAVDADQPEVLALACAAVGLDRSVFPTILELVRELNAGRPAGGADGARQALNAFGRFAPEDAANAFRYAIKAG